MYHVYKCSLVALVVALLLSCFGHAQQLSSSHSGSHTAEMNGPRPYAYGGLALNSGGGYSSTAGSGGAGVEFETSRLSALAEFAAASATKQDPGTGYELHAKSRAFLRTHSNWFYGGGGQWNRLSTSAYSKEFWRPAFGGGKDIFRESISMRAQVLYVLPGTDHLNALQGPELSLWLPSPASAKHFFYRQTIGIYEFHQTSVPGNSGTNDRSVASFSEFTVMYRF